MKKVSSGGGWRAIRYAWHKAREVGPLRFWQAMHSKNACKTCALGMGGQLGGMRNEAGHFPEVCKKSMQAMVADMRGKIDPRLFETYSIKALQGLSPRELEAFGRLTAPIIAEPRKTHFRSISWDEALDRVAEGLKGTDPERAFFYSSGRSSSEAGFLLHLLARSFGTNHISNCSFYCHQASGAGLKDSIGTSTATVDLDDLEHCDLLFLIGGNPASNHPRMMTSLMRLRKRGGRIIVVNPVRETGLVNYRIPSNVRSLLLGTEIASTYLQPRIGGDIAVLCGIAKALIDSGQIESGFIAEHTEGFDAFRTLVESTTWEDIERSSGLDRSTLKSVAHEYAQSERAIFAWTMGVTHHEHGVHNVQWIVNLALLRGMIGRQGAGVLPIRGHSNVQGMGTVGVTPTLTQSAVTRLESIGLAAPKFKGHDTLSALEAAGRGELDFGLCLGGNLYGASPDADFCAAALAKLKTLTYVSTTLNVGHAHGLAETTLILPALVRDEEPQSTTQESMFSYVRLSDGGPQRFAGPRSEVDILCDLATRTFPQPSKIDWHRLRDHDEIRRLIAQLVEGLEPIGEIGRTKQEFHIPGRRLTGPQFQTASGRAAFRAISMPSHRNLREDELLLMTVRSEGQFNTVVYEEEDLYRGQERRDVVLMNPADIDRIGLQENQLVSVSNEVGKLDNRIVRPYAIAPGCALMYFPEANMLIPRAVDPVSKTPAFKSAVVRVEAVKDADGQLAFLEPRPVAGRMSIDVSSRNRMKAC